MVQTAAVTPVRISGVWLTQVLMIYDVMGIMLVFKDCGDFLYQIVEQENKCGKEIHRVQY